MPTSKQQGALSASGKIEQTARRHARAVDVHVGHRIRIARQGKKMTQSDLAVPVNVTYQQIQRYERGTSRVAVSTLVLLAKALDLPLKYFLQGIDEMVCPSKGEKEPPSEGFEIVALVTKVENPALRRRILAIVREAAGISDDLQSTAKELPIISRP